MEKLKILRDEYKRIYEEKQLTADEVEMAYTEGVLDGIVLSITKLEENNNED